MNGAHSGPAYSFGPALHDNGVLFRLWAPAASSITLLVQDPAHSRASGNPDQADNFREQEMQPQADGWFTVDIPGGRAGTRYKFRIDGELEVLDPASAFQPKDVFGPSEVVDHGAYKWRTKDWRGRPWEEAVVLELHVGTFTAEGTFRAANARLDDVVETGVTAIELMPVADFAGRWNWGYDGVLLYAPDSAYGTPDDLKTLIDEAHRRGLMVFLDVVYNHFGPEGNFLPRYAPQFFCNAQTPWGSAIDYRVPQVRDFAIENALHWLDRYRFDGLRLDAVHAIVEAGEPPILHELSAAVARFAHREGREIHLVLENDDNSAHLLAPDGSGRPLYRAQWNDDYHHAWHVLLTGERDHYYKDYAPAPLRHLERMLASGFAYQGESSKHRGGRKRGEQSGDLPPSAFVNFLQNHDQIGNRALGERLTALAEAAAIDAALAVLLLAPMTPLLYMGEPWGSDRPFPFFCDFKGDLADTVRRGRRAEFSEAYERHGDAVPDPLAKKTFLDAKLDWDTTESGKGKRRLDHVRALLALRTREIVPRLRGARFGSARETNGIVRADWKMGDERLHLLANLTARPAASPDGLPPARAIYGDAPPAELPPWSVYWSIGNAV
jgi:malto-oligosyltrehalose trehalohydrolase